jgi:ankyrin repeat protein
LPIVEQLLSLGFSINETDKFLRTPIHIAACFGFRELLLHLLSVGDAKINSRDLYGYSPLHLAMARGHHDIVEDLIMFGGDVNFKRENGLTCVHDCMIRNDLKGLQFFNQLQKRQQFSKDKRILFNTKDQLGNTPLFRGIMSSSLDCVQELLKNGNLVSTNVKNDKGMNCFHLASVAGNADMVEQLFVFNEQISMSLIKERNSRGETPLHIASKLGNWRIIDRLLTLMTAHNRLRQLSTTTTTTTTGTTASNKLIQTLEDQEDPLGLNVQDNFGNTPLHMAILERKTRTFKLLVEAKSRQDIPNKMMETAASLLKDLEQKHFDRILTLKELNDVNKGYVKPE